MALNPNHTFEDLEDIKCSIVEKNCTPERVDFLKKLLEHNKFEVVVAKSPPPKAAKPAPAPKPAAPPADGAEPSAAAPAADAAALGFAATAAATGGSGGKNLASSTLRPSEAQAASHAGVTAFCFRVFMVSFFFKKRKH